MKITDKQLEALLKTEEKAHSWAEDYCNIPISEDSQAKRESIITKEVRMIFGGRLPRGFFYNLDPRGYALKINPEKGSTEGLETDWGRYGILSKPIR